MPVSLKAAAAALGKSEATVRRWVQAGAPCASPGAAGRGKGALVDVAAIARWRSGTAEPGHAELLAKLSAALWNVFKRDAGLGDPGHIALGMRDYQAAAYLALVFERCARDLTGSVPEPLPAEMRDLLVLVEQTTRK